MSHVNEAGWERALRILVGASLLSLGWSGAVDGGWGDFVRVFGFVPLVTGLVGWCPIYALFGFRTNHRRERIPVG